MRERRVILFALAAVLVVAAVALVMWYVNTAEERAQRDVELVDALVATAPIPAGTTGQTAIDNGWVGFEERERGAIPDNIVRSPDDIRDLLAAANVSERQFITTDTFVTRERVAEGGPLVSQIAQEGDDDPSSRQAVAITLDTEKTVDGNVQPGDIVNIVAIGDAADQDGRVAGFLLTEVPIIGRPAGNGDVEGAGGSIIVSLEPDDILKLLAARQSGAVLWLTLIPRDYDTAAPPPVFLPDPAPLEGVVPISPF